MASEKIDQIVPSKYYSHTIQYWYIGPPAILMTRNISPRNHVRDNRVVPSDTMIVIIGATGPVRGGASTA